MSRKPSKYQIILLLGLLLVVGTISLITRFLHSSVSQQERVAEILNQYIKQKLIVNDFLDEKIQQISYTDNTFQHIAGATFEEILSQAENQFSGNEKFYKVPLIEYIKTISLELVSETQYKNKVKINEIPSEDSINIFILKEEPEKLVRHFDNCSYIGWMNSILCNIDFLENQVKYIESFDKAYDFSLFDLESRRLVDIFSDGEEESAEQVKNFIISSFLTWVIGHEIGHAIHHKDYVIGSNKEIHHDSAIYEKLEDEADLFLVEALKKSSNKRGKPTQTAALFWLSLGEYFQHLLKHQRN